MSDHYAELIAKLEAATEGSRSLDAMIWLASQPQATQERSHMLGDYRFREMCVQHGRLQWEMTHDPLRYTTSLDSALTLVPEGDWNGEISWHFGELRKGGYVELNLANPAWKTPDGFDLSLPPDAHAACVNSYEDQEPDNFNARPLALALCIAALKARAGA